ncbi:MAG: hypothetical protein GEV28_00210 [Actinophytocola sp.]|uniref:hypothetical protein n=1 Tax=Actinophytocola sp. TaxID=1872138 RepID=UPI00132734B8|nr:hypothetical protein [Actinophytocola sp.]MPZ78894.1 hypothetical protein [Actinophytocola sp.]
MADESFDSHRGEIEDFENSFIDLCYEIVDATYDSDNAYYVTFPNILEGKYAAPREYIDSIVLPTSYDFDTDEFNPSVYRDDIANLTATELPRFLDGAELGSFDEIDTRLREAANLLDLAGGYYGFEQLLILMDKWSGRAAYNFQHKVLATFETMLVHQLVFIDELGAVSLCLRELIDRARGDGLGLAQDLKAKVDRGGSSISLGTALWVIGSIAAGVATFGSSAPVTAAVWAARTATVVNTAAGAIGQVQKLSGRQDGAERAIEGDTAYEFIPSCLNQIDRIIREGLVETGTLMDTLAADLGNAGIKDLSMAEPRLLDDEGSDDFHLTGAAALSEEVLIESIADLRFAGVVLLPTMAQYFDDAHGQVAGLDGVFDSAVGYSPVADTSRHTLKEAVGVLADSFAEVREFLYRAGVVLTDIADTYLATEEQNEAMLANFNLQLDEVDTDQFPQYQP